MPTISGPLVCVLHYVLVVSLVLGIASCHGQSAGITGLPDDPVVPRGEFAVQVHAYTPAPGQFVRQYGDPTRALGMPDGQVVTLGGFGGSLSVVLPRAIRNRPGPDFVVWGNALFRGGDPRVRWAEPALVEVSSDGMDWLVIEGSLLGGRAAGTLRRSVLYQKTNEQAWPPSAGELTRLELEGCDLTTSFCSNLSTSEGWSWTNASLPLDGLWGHADATPSVLPLAEYWTPDEPRVPGVQGAGGDAIDLDWARTEDGSIPPASGLTNIRYIRLTTAVSLTAGVLGEFSTEIDAVGVCW